MTVFDAILKVLSDSPDEPLHIDEITVRIRQGGLVQRTGEALGGSVGARLAEHTRTTQASERLFARTGAGLYSLTTRGRRFLEVD